MQTTLILTGLFMGLAGGPHCVAMCGAACVGIKRTSGSTNRPMWFFQFGRLLGYSLLGAVVAASMQGLGWLSVHAAALRPVWTLFHVAAAMLGFMLVWQARQPMWLASSARAVWLKVRAVASGLTKAKAPALTALLLGALWALLPCGLLYSALLVAALTGQLLEGAAVMAMFALGSGVSLVAAPWLWLRLYKNGSSQWPVRIAGLVLMVSSLWAIWMGLVHNTAPWCTTFSSPQNWFATALWSWENFA